ncbi:MAG: glycosyltransferase [Candidatus Dependentiae bacterium]|nr:glycosyltransferase [Candidatus Dependentiae bacterium]
MKLPLSKLVILLIGIGASIYAEEQTPIWRAKVDCSGQEQPLVVVIPSYNNAHYIERTLNSVFSQEYSNYRVVFIDDGSSDDSVQVMNQYIEENSDVADKITFIQNDRRWRKLRNVYYAIHRHCADEEIVVMLDCDDFLAHPGVFNMINDLYADPDVWFMYGGDEPYPKAEAAAWGITKENMSQPTPDEVVRNNSFRQYNWVYMHIRTFRAWLFKITPIDEMISARVAGFQGKFYPACIDYIFIYPMLERAQWHMRYNPEFIYYWNADNPINSFKVDRTLQAASAVETRDKRAYQPLEQEQTYLLDKYDTAKADLIVFSDSTPDKLSQMLMAQEQWLSGVENISVIYQADTEPIKQQYQQLTRTYPQIQWYDMQSSISLTSVVSYGTAEHCVLMRDTVSMINPINFNKGILALEETGAYAFYYNLGASNGSIVTAGGDIGVPSQEIMDNWHVWKFSCDTCKAIKTYAPNMVLYRKADIMPLFRQYSNKIGAYLHQWENMLPDQNKVGMVLTNPSVR